ncbi:MULTISPECIES: GLUG motif-containing protein [Burkholderia]|uniref:Filamentous hemagglutinin N-terminal domain-containing protein n=1 Tax=Burkholderia contaminans TaxID=488447 RepID=A0A2S5E8I2_9BURK|nr:MULTISPECIES: GLUG motif-containing protein [Burkholderia]EKS9798735.1 filamentous hemagglutinin N-terminal domain-containing protein [Burkholderia cepacia]EKS9803173.1 filamentous hemagglutinin N-terminal domain-containing protein [Burkholderia cepacia]EKS9810657.1 filamentous hemagglutinin N-terminal domain-containing protein [Burkholderia cepacia]EKS9819612.1 filamentous hemagglutinin N-terminal domain-containing protein [Burkholderia cepacia]EKS9827230.1 filamentous hemagglutinin N-term
MNKTYALVWNGAQRCWTAVGETARRRGKSAGGKHAAVAAVSLLGFVALPAFALPSGEAVTSGKADFVRSDDGRSMNINQHTDKLITNWQDFSIAGGERLAFNQPNSQSLALNRVIGSTGSRIDGNLSANGRVFLVNPNGVLFGSGAQVNVGGLVASTQNLADADFLAGNYRFSGSSTASVVNNGKITAADGGSVALLGARVANNGTIQAKLGRVALGAGNAFTVNFDGNGLLNLQVDAGAVDAQASNGGLLKADGGEVLMTARSAGNLLDAVVNNTGTIEARGLNARGGKITLDGGIVKVAGKLDASAAATGAPTGTVLTRGERVTVANDTTVDTRSGNAAGTWTIEAANAGVGGDGSIAADTLSRNLGTTNVALTNTRNDLNVDAPVSWASDYALTLTSKNANVNLRKALSASGANASLVVNAADRIRVSDAVKLTGRNAHLELNAKNGHAFETANAVVTLSGDNASFRSNGEDYKVIHTLDELRGVDSNLKGRYVLGNGIDGNNAEFRSIGGDYAFTGKFDGLGNAISRLNITNPGRGMVGLFAINTGRIANLSLQRITTTALTPRNGFPVSIGTLAGANLGEISNVTARDIYVAASGPAYIGGLVGSNYSGTIDRATVSGKVDGDQSTLAIGGLVGENTTVLWPRSPAAKISNSHADVRVAAARSEAIGGLVGTNDGVIETSSSAGSVIASGSFAKIGGLVGVNRKGSVITGSWSSSSVTAGQNANAGGLVGVNDGEIDTSRAHGDVVTADSASAGGLVGLNRGRIADSQASGNVKTGASSRAGGLAGQNEGAIARATAAGRVLAGANSMAGGLVGRNAGTGDIRASTARGDVQVLGKGTLGGLVGVNEGSIDASSAEGTVTAGNDSTAGGLVGDNTGKIAGSRASGKVVAGNASVAGGLAGSNTGTIASSSATGDVLAGNDSTAGGLVGVNKGTVDRSDASGNVTAGIRSAAGGLIGRNAGTVLASTATGNVQAGAQSDAGGLIGRSEAGRVAESVASGSVEAGDNSTAGGLIGRLGGAVDGSRATGSVRAGAQSQVGGLVGLNGGTIAKSFSSGTVSGGRNAHLGGLAGINLGRIEGSTTDSRIAFTSGFGQLYGALAGINYGTLSGNRTSSSGVALVGSNLGQLKD